MIARKVVCRMTKREARAWAKARRAELDMAAVGRGMAQALFSLPQWQSAGAVLAFAAMPDEPDGGNTKTRAGRRKAPAAAPRAEQNRDGLGGDTGIAPAAARGVRHSGTARRPARRRPGGIRRGAGPCPLPGRQPRRGPAGARRRVL